MSIAKFVAQKLRLTVRLWVAGLVSLLKEDPKILPTSVCQRFAQWVREEFPNCFLMRIMVHECDPDVKGRFIMVRYSENRILCWTLDFQKNKKDQQYFDSIICTKYSSLSLDQTAADLVSCLVLEQSVSKMGPQCKV